MNYFAIYLNDNFIGFIKEEAQKAFLLECNPDHQFYVFEWEQDNPPMPSDVSLVDGELQVTL
jgi:hypothetical protein